MIGEFDVHPAGLRAEQRERFGEHLAADRKIIGRDRPRLHTQCPGYERGYADRARKRDALGCEHVGFYAPLEIVEADRFETGSEAQLRCTAEFAQEFGGAMRRPNAAERVADVGMKFRDRDGECRFELLFVAAVNCGERLLADVEPFKEESERFEDLLERRSDRRTENDIALGSDRPIERHAHVIEFSLERCMPIVSRRTHALLRCARCEAEHVTRMRCCNAIPFAARGQPLESVGAGGFEQRIARVVVVAVVEGNERLVDQGREDVEDVPLRNRFRGARFVYANRLRRFERPAAGEYRESAQDATLGLEQQIVAPVDQSTKRLLAWQRGARTAA